MCKYCKEYKSLIEGSDLYIVGNQLFNVEFSTEYVEPVGDSYTKINTCPMCSKNLVFDDTKLREYLKFRYTFYNNDIIDFLEYVDDSDLSYFWNIYAGSINLATEYIKEIVSNKKVSKSKYVTLLKRKLESNGSQDKSKEYCEFFDAYYKDEKWLEEKCNDPECWYCPNRPDIPCVNCKVEECLKNEELL